MEYLYYQLRMEVKMTKKDYSNKVITLDPLSDKLDAAGFSGGASKTKLKTSTSDKKLKQSEYQSRLRRYFEGYGSDPRKKFKKGMKKTEDGKLVPNYVKVNKLNDKKE